VGHASLVPEEGSQVDRLGSVITGEGLDLSSVAGGSLAGQEPEGPVAGMFVLAVGLFARLAIVHFNTIQQIKYHFSINQRSLYAKKKPFDRL
jgi:hypothetical protein